MALTINSGANSMASGKQVKPGVRLWLNASRDKLVKEGDPEAAILYCTEHSKVNADEYKRLKGPKAREDKSRKGAAEDKGSE